MVVGVWFAKSILTKIGVRPRRRLLPASRGIGSLAGRDAEAHREVRRGQSDSRGTRAFCSTRSIPNSHVFATLTALGEVGVGISLLFGLLTPLGAFFGMLQVIFYGMAVQQQSSGQQGFHVMLFMLMLTFLFTRAGRQWGIDARLRERWPNSRFVQLFT